MIHIERRISRLESSGGVGIGFAERLSAARARLASMTPEEREREEKEHFTRMQRAYSAGELHGLWLRLFEAGKRMRNH
jgi:hypothetical protein